MSRILHWLCNIAAMILGDRTNRLTDKLLKTVTWSLPEEDKARYHEEWLSVQDDIDDLSLKLANAISLTWLMRYAIVRGLFISMEKVETDNTKYHSWHLEEDIIEDFKLDFIRTVDEIPEHYISYIVGGKVFVTLFDTGRARTICLKKSSMGLYIGIDLKMPNGGHYPCARKVVVTDQVALKFAETAQEYNQNSTISSS